MSDAARVVWSAIVRSVPSEHFRASDAPLLRSFCEATALADQASEMIATEGAVIGGKANAWLIAQEKGVRAQAALALRLRLCPSARIDARAAARGEEGRGPMDANAAADIVLGLRS